MRSGLPPFRNRSDAGRRLADAVVAAGLTDPVIATVPPGGAVAALEIAGRLRAPLEYLVLLAVNAPAEPTVPIGYVIGGKQPHIHVDEEKARAHFLPPGYLDEQSRQLVAEANRLQIAYRGIHNAADFTHRNVVLVTDGTLPDAALVALCWSLDREFPDSVTMALPAARRSTLSALEGCARRVIHIEDMDEDFQPEELYEEAEDLSDERIRDIGRQAEAFAPGA